MNNSFVLALATLVGTIIGAGIFGLPYVFAKSGIIAGLFYFVLLGGLVLALHLMFGEIALRTQEKHRLIGYASLYLGSWAKKLVTLSTVVGIAGALLAYIILAGDFLSIVFGSVVPLSSFQFALLFWLGLSLFIVRGIQQIAQMEVFFNIALFSVVGVMVLFALPHIEIQQFQFFEPAYIFLPYGVMLFAFWGLSAIPEIAELFKNNAERGRLDNLIVLASLISGALFLVFVFFIVGVSGAETSEDALTGLIPFLGEKIVLLGALFGLIAIAASFLVLGNYLKNSLRYDYKVPYGFSAAIAIFSPIFLFGLGLREFILVIGIVGAAVAAIDGSLTAFIWVKAKTKGDRVPEYSLRFPRSFVFVLAALLALGAVFEIWFDQI